MVLGDFEALEALQLERRVFRVAVRGSGRRFINFSAPLPELIEQSMREPMNIQLPCASREYLQLEEKILSTCRGDLFMDVMRSM